MVCQCDRAAHHSQLKQAAKPIDNPRAAEGSASLKYKGLSARRIF